jgi:diacylglycerol O-acyltransferase / wax synthase
MKRLNGMDAMGLSVSLPVDIADPAERSRLVAVATRIAKEDHASWARSCTGG